MPSVTTKGLPAWVKHNDPMLSPDIRQVRLSPDIRRIVWSTNMDPDPTKLADGEPNRFILHAGEWMSVIVYKMRTSGLYA